VKERNIETEKEALGWKRENERWERRERGGHDKEEKGKERVREETYRD